MTPERIEEIKRILGSGRTVHLGREEVYGLLAALEEAQQQLSEAKEINAKWALDALFKDETEVERKLAEAQQTIARQQQKIDAALSWTWNCGEANMLEVIAALKGETQL